MKLIVIFLATLFFTAILFVRPKTDTEIVRETVRSEMSHYKINEIWANDLNKKLNIRLRNKQLEFFYFE